MCVGNMKVCLHPKLNSCLYRRVCGGEGDAGSEC